MGVNILVLLGVIHRPLDARIIAGQSSKSWFAGGQKAKALRRPRPRLTFDSLAPSLCPLAGGHSHHKPPLHITDRPVLRVWRVLPRASMLETIRHIIITQTARSYPDFLGFAFANDFRFLFAYTVAMFGMPQVRLCDYT